MKTSIKTILTEVSEMWSNKPKPSQVNLSFKDMEGSVKGLTAGQTVCIGVRNLDDCPGEEDSEPALVFYDKNDDPVQVDYSVEKDLGLLEINANYPSVAGIKGIVYNRKLNCRGMVSVWNRAANEMNQLFLNSQYVKINKPVSVENDVVDKFNMNEPPFNQFSDIAGIFQNERDDYSWTWNARGDDMFIEDEDLGMETFYEYGEREYHNVRKLRYPFYIEGSIKIPSQITEFTEEVMEKEFYLDSGSLNQFRLQLMYYGTEKLFYDYQNIDASNASYLKQQMLSKEMFSLNNSLFGDLRKKAIPKAARYDSSVHRRRGAGDDNIFER